jgi:hypothetical protein
VTPVDGRTTWGRAVLGLQWTVATALGWGVPLALAPHLGPVLGLPIGIALGTAQWLVLRGRIRQAAWWVPASTVAWYLGLRMAALHEPGNLLWCGGLGGGIAGVLQSVILLRKTPLSALWAPASALLSILGWTVGVWVGWAAGATLDSLRLLLAGIAGGALFGVGSAPLLLWLLHPPRERPLDDAIV